MENKETRSRAVALILLALLGVLGIHNFYLGRRDTAIAELVLFVASVLTFWFLVGFVTYFALIVMLAVDLYYILTSKDTYLTWQLR